jgi:hypothetical protein
MDVAVDTAQAHRLNHFCHLLFKVRFSKESELTVRGITASARCGVDVKITKA